MEKVKAFKRKMLLWTSNWSQDDQQSGEEVSFTPDAVEIASLLQAIGFRIRFMDRSLPKEICPVSGVPADCPACRVILMCPRSGVRMELEAPTSSCRCPSPDNSGLGKTWTFEEPACNEQMTKAVDSLVPKISSEISKTVSELIGGLFNVMNLFPDLNHNEIKAPFDSRVFPTTATSTYNHSSPMKTPASGIAVVTPNASCVPKAAQGDSKIGLPGRYRSLDTLISTGGFPDDLPEPGQLTPKDDARSGSDTHMEVDGELDTTMTQGPGSATKKFISKSSPAVSCTEKFEKSNNFNFEDIEMEDGDSTAGNKKSRKLLRSNTYVADDGEPRAGPPPRTTPSPLAIYSSSSQNAILLSKLQDIQQSVSDVIFIVAGNETNLSNIGEVCKKSKAVAGAVQQRTTDNVRPIRCLSDFGSVPNLTRASTTVRSIPRPNMRRYATSMAAPATPTTSRRSGTTSGERTKKVLNTSKTGSNRLVPPGNSGQKICVSPSSATSSKDKQTGFTVSPNRRANNTDKKYAHVQSNIPKPGISRNK